MILASLERMADGTPCLEACTVGDAKSPTHIFIDVLFYRETLKAGTYSLIAGERVWTFDLPQDEVQVTEQGLPGIKWNAQITLKEG
jgi:hypothetical protein